MAPERSPVIYQARASADVRGAYLWYETQRPGLGEEFLASLSEAETRASMSPQAGSPQHRNTRRVLLKRFPYGLYYRFDGLSLIVVACYHFRRDPEGWKRA